MSSGQNYLTDLRKRWRRLTPTELANCSDDERRTVRELEEQFIQSEFAALSDIILNCRNKYQFAKTYRVLRADLSKTLAGPGNPNAPDHVNSAVKAAMKLVGDQKLSGMAGWFFIEFADERERDQAVGIGKRVESVIERYAGKEGSGCAGVVLLWIAVTASCVVTSFAV